MGLSVKRSALRNYIVRSLNDLPALPAVINKILEMTDDPTTSASDMEKLLAHEPSFVAKLMRVVNSAYYGLPGQVSSISHAVMILGFQQVRNLALSVAAFALVRANQPGLAKLQVSFWRHAFGVGLTAPEIVGRKGGSHEARDLAQVGGLLHDVGSLYLFSTFTDHYRDAIERASRENLSLPEAEIAVLGIAHDEVGGMIARAWNFPEPLCFLIGNHYQWDAAENNLCLAGVCAADTIVAQAGYPIFPLTHTETDSKARAWLGLAEEEEQEFLEWIRERVSGAEQVFEIL